MVAKNEKKRDQTVSSWFSLRHLSDHNNPKPFWCKLGGHRKHWFNEITCASLDAEISIYRCDREDTYYLEVTEKGMGIDFSDNTRTLQIKHEIYKKIDTLLNDWDGKQKSFQKVVVGIGEILATQEQWIYLGYVTPLSYLFQVHGEPAFTKFQG